MHRTRDETLRLVTDHLGGRKALMDYMTASAIETEHMPPPRAVEVLADYRPYGGVVIVGYEDGKWWDTDAGVSLGAAPGRWAPLPPDID